MDKQFGILYSCSGYPRTGNVYYRSILVGGDMPCLYKLL